jgi:dolichol-phosphate mannosyltransferase
MVRGYSWTVTPITWRNRRVGFSKLKIREMGSRYLFIALYCWLEKYFSGGDYRKEPADTDSRDVAVKAARGGASQS